MDLQPSKAPVGGDAVTASSYQQDYQRDVIRATNALLYNGVGHNRHDRVKPVRLINQYSASD